MALLDAARITIDTGFGLRRIGEGADYAWRDEFELGDDGEFTLVVWDGRARRGTLTARIISGSEAGAILEQANIMLADDALEAGVSMLHIDMVRVSPEARGKGYAVRLLKVAVTEFKQTFVWAQVFSQRVYRSFRAVLPEPVVAIPGTSKYGIEEPMHDPTDDDVNEFLDEEPIESEAVYKNAGFKLMNKRYVYTLFRTH